MERSYFDVGARIDQVLHNVVGVVLEDGLSIVALRLVHLNFHVVVFEFRRGKNAQRMQKRSRSNGFLMTLEKW
jgi:hypothetical protein